MAVNVGTGIDYEALKKPGVELWMIRAPANVCLPRYS